MGGKRKKFEGIIGPVIYKPLLGTVACRLKIRQNNSKPAIEKIY
jgi:hypothetical protein